MKNLKTAIKAFWTIATGKDHVYSDERINSFAGTPTTLRNYISGLLSLASEELKQETLVLQAKELIKQK